MMSGHLPHEAFIEETGGNVRGLCEYVAARHAGMSQLGSGPEDVLQGAMLSQIVNRGVAESRAEGPDELHRTASLLHDHEVTSPLQEYYP